MVVAACCLGFIRLSVKQPSIEHFAATESQSRQDLQHAGQFFPLLEARQEQIIMTPKHGQNILANDCLKDAILVHRTVVNISGYKNLCFRQLLPKGTNENQNCVIISPLELAGINFEHLNNLSSILAREWNNPRAVLSNGQTFRSSFRQILGGFQVVQNTDPPTSQAEGLRIIYFIRKATSEEEDHKILNFETSFESHISSANQQMECASLSFKTGRAAAGALQSVLQPEIMPLYLSALVIVLLVFIVTYLSCNNISCFTTVLLILSSVLLPLTCAAGIASMASISLSPTTLFIPFLLLGKATSDVVFLFGEWERQKKIPSLEHRASSSVARAGILQVISSLCGSILFGIAIKSSFQVISGFFLVTLVAFVTISVASFIVTVTMLLSLEGPLKAVNSSCSRPCRRRRSFPDARIFGEGPMEQLKAKLQQFLENFTKILTSLGAKFIAFIILVCIVSLCVFSALQRGERTSSSISLYRQNDNFKEFNKARQKLFGNETDVSIVFSEKVDYSQQNLQNQLINLCKTLREASDSQEDAVCWMMALLQWAKDQNMSCSNSEFHLCLNLFLNQSRNIAFRQDVRFEHNKTQVKILASRIHVQMALHNSFKEDRRLLERLRHDLQKQSSLKPAPVSKTFFEIDDLFSLEREVVFALAIATAAAFVLFLFSSSFIRISLFLALTFDLLILEAAGIMETWGIHLNHITFISLFLTIVLAFNLSVQVAHSFVFSEKQAVRDRMNKALRSVGLPLLIAALLEIAGSISLGFIYPSLQDIFFRLIPLVLILGLLHALVIFPPIITLFFEIMVRFDSPKEEDIMLHSIRKRSGKEGMSLKLRDSEVSKVKPKRPGISIVGISCRFPGANNKDQFWDLLEQGKSSIGPFPENREEEHKAFSQFYHSKRFVSGRHCVTTGSYMEDIHNFDNEFFGITNQEARSMDPQQRILLEVVYEAIEDAGMRLEDLQKCRTGVFLGVMNLDYGALLTDTSNYNNINQFTFTGMTASILANRVSFCLNLTGPSIAVDTACSSSLTALKLACDNLHHEDCEIAIVCAPNIVINHTLQIVASMAGLLAPDGRCKSFNASGDGYGRGEGFAAIILKLSHAAASDKDDEYCEIIACGMNNDGHNAIPMTAPSSKIQAELSRMVLEQSGVRAEDVDYLEAHGTGTAIGDVVEVTSIANTYTKETTNPTRNLRIGSVKSILNHTESTSGLAGLIKVALMIKKQRLVPTINVQVLNPKLKLEEKGLVVQQTNERWMTENGKPRIAAVNSFGYGGSNVHVILREVEPVEVMNGDYSERVNNVLTLSARSKEALKRMAQLYSGWFKDNEDAIFVEDLCYSLNERRSQFPHRLALSFGAISEASKSLEDYADDSVGWEKVVSYGEVTSSNPKLVFMFGGQGSQWYAMGRQLIESQPVFEKAIVTVSNLVRELGKPWSLIDELMATEEESRIAENSIAQPATFAVQYATAQLLMSWRIYPSAVIGHSLGEFAAACIAGIITLKEAVQLVLTRSTLQDQCPNNGGMAALGMSEEMARTLLIDLKLSATLSIAAVNDAKSVTVSGDSQSIEALGQHLAMHANDTFWRVLGTKRAFHSPHMELIKKPFQAAMKRVKLNPQLSKIPVYSTVAGEVISGEQFNRDYWWRNIRCPVQFYPAVKHVLKDGYKQIIEISTQPILAHYVKQIALQENLQNQPVPVVLATLPRKRVPISDQHKSFLLTTVCKLYTLGFPIDWECVQGSPTARFVRTIHYPWLRNSFWYRDIPPQTIIPPLGVNKCNKMETHPFLEKVKMTELNSGLQCWETEIDLHRFPNLKDHALIQGGTVMPGAAYLEMAFAMVRDQFVDVTGLELSDVKLSSLLTLPDTQVTKFQYG